MPRIRGGEVELEYEERGSGQPLLMILGIGEQIPHWHPEFLDRLASRGFRVITFDNRDAGLSTHCDQFGPPDVHRCLVRAALGLPIAAPYTLSDMARDSVALLDALGIERAHLFGMSMGGMIAQTVALEHPGRVLSLTSALSTPGGRRYGLVKPRVVRAFLARAPRTRSEAVESALRFARAHGTPHFWRDEDWTRRVAETAWDRGYTRAGYGRQLLAILASGSRRLLLPAVRAPTLVVHGTDDPVIPAAAARATARLVPRARLRMVRGLGHELPPAIWPLVVNSVDSLAMG